VRKRIRFKRYKKQETGSKKQENRKPIVEEAEMTTTSMRFTVKHPIARKRGFATLAACLVMFMAFAAPALAQLDTGAIAGTVFDPAGRVVAGARVSITGQDTGTSYATLSSSTGYYIFPSVHTGRYDLSVAAAGFKTELRNGVVVSVGANTAQDITLAVGAASETISVAASAETLEADTSTIDDSIQPEQVSKLPLTVAGWRSLESLESLVPGVVAVGVAAATDPIKIDGGQEAGTDFLVDGITTNRQENGSGSFNILSPSVDAVNEFQVSIASLPIDEGRSTGGLANFNTKGGTNDYHGSAYEFYKNAGFDGNSWFDNGFIAQQGNTAAAREEYKRPADTKNDFGGNLGGPIRIPGLYNGKKLFLL
jgi:hypothetical protein